MQEIRAIAQRLNEWGSINGGLLAIVGTVVGVAYLVLRRR